MCVCGPKTYLFTLQKKNSSKRDIFCRCDQRRNDKQKRTVKQYLYRMYNHHVIRRRRLYTPNSSSLSKR